MANINIGINVVWDNQKQMQQAKADLLSLGKSALLSADNFGTTGAEINKAFSNMLPSIKTSTQALKVFTTDGYLAWTKYQKEVDEATKGQQKALSTQVKNMSAGFDKMSKAPDATISSMKKYLKTIQSVQAEYERVAKLNKTATASFSSTSFLKTIEKQKKATAEWGSEFVAVSQAMDAIKKKGATLELGNASGKQTKNIKALRDEYNSLQAQLNKMDVSKFNKAMQTQYSYTESTKGVLDALKEKYKTLDVAIKGMISSGDTKNLESYKQKLLSVKNTITKLQDASEQFNKEGFFSTLDKNSEAIEAMDGRLAAVNARMKMLRTTILKFTESGKASEAELKELRTEYAKLSKEQAVLQKSTDGTATRIKNLIKSFVSAQAIVWLVRSVFTKFIGTLKEASQAAAAAEETMNLFDVVFENVGDEAEEMAGRMSKSFGVAKSSIAEGLSTLGDFAEGLGMSNQNALDFANTLSSRMLDVISFKNVTGDTTDILKNLASGLAGNTENFRTWGIVIKESSVKLWLAKNNMDKLTGTALELAKVQARAALFMEQSTNAAGDMARTFDSTTNIARRLTEANKQLNENIGVGINEIVTPVKKGLLNIVTSWNNATAAKKAYAEIDAFKNDTKPQDNSQNKELIVDFLKEMYKSPFVVTGASSSIPTMQAPLSESSVVDQINDQGINLKEFNAMVKLLGGSIDDTLSVFKDLGVEVNSNVLWYARLTELARERAKLEGEQLQSLKDFNETVASWSSTDTSGVFKPVAQALSDIITPFESATGTERSSSELAKTYQAELKTEFETAYNNLIQAQKGGNKGLAEKAQSTLDTITKQYKSAQFIIDQEAQNAKDQADSAKALSDAAEAFKTAMSGVLANITTMNSNISEMMRNAGVSASMLGSDSSMVSIEQNRQTALLGVRNQNQQAQQTFAKKNNVDLVKYNYLATSKAAGFSIPKNIESSDSFKEYEALLKAQSESLKKTNTYYDLLASNAKVQLSYSDAQAEISKESLATYKETADAELEALQLKVESGEVTQKFYEDQKKIYDDNLKNLQKLNTDQDAAQIQADADKSAEEIATAFKDASDVFQTSMSEVLNNITSMKSNINTMFRNAGISASMLGSDSSLITNEQNRQTALLGVKAQNRQARLDFDTKQSKAYSNLKATTPTDEFDAASEKFYAEQKTKLEALIAEQNENLKNTNIYYDLLGINAKAQLAYSNAQVEISKESVDNYKTSSNEALKELKTKVDSGEVTQKYYEDQKKIYDDNIKTLEGLNLKKDADIIQSEADESAKEITAAFKNIKEALGSLSGINTSRTLNIGGSGLYAGATKTYKDNLSKLGVIRAKIIDASGSGIMSDSDADKLALKLQDIKDAYAKDKNQAYLDATGISTGADATLIKNITSILSGSKIEGMFKDIGKSITGLFSQGGEDGEGKGIFSGATKAVGGLFSQGDENGDGAGALSGITGMFSSLSNVLGPIIKVLVYVLSKTQSFQKILSVIIDALDELAPIIDSFLQPLMLVLDPLVTLLKNTLIPLLEILFPIIKAFMFVLLPLIAVIDTLRVWMTALGETIKAIVTFHWWDIDDAWKNAAKKTGQIWDETNDQLEELKNMTLDTTEGLTEANSDYVDAVNDMLTNGLLTGQEALQMIASEAGTSYTGNNYRYMDSDSYNKGAGTVNIGTVTIDAKGKTMEEITEELRQMSYENSVTGGVSY